MEKLLPKWLMKRYLFLLNELKEHNKKEFDFAFAEKALSKMGSSPKIVPLFLSELRKAGWLEVKLDPEDTRKRIYSIRQYKEVFESYINHMLNRTKSRKR